MGEAQEICAMWTTFSFSFCCVVVLYHWFLCLSYISSVYVPDWLLKKVDTWDSDRKLFHSVLLLSKIGKLKDYLCWLFWPSERLTKMPRWMNILVMSTQSVLERLKFIFRRLLQHFTTESIKAWYGVVIVRMEKENWF